MTLLIQSVEHAALEHPVAADDMIYDVGAHLGEDSDFYLKLGYRVVAVEAHPSHAAELRRRFADEIAQARFTLVERVIAERPGQVDFYICESVSVWGTTEPDWAERNARQGAPSRRISLPATTFDTILCEHGMPSYLKIDIEGADLLCLKALLGFRERPTYVSIEASDLHWRKLVAEFDLLHCLGYRRFQIVPQGRHGRGRFATRDGGIVEHEFDEHCSGPYGAYLDGRWLTRRQALWQYFWLLAYSRLFPPDGRIGRRLQSFGRFRRLTLDAGWYDTHARL